jgi:hypothetical protein
MFHRKLSFIIEMIREEDEEGVEHLRCVAGWKEIPRSSLLKQVRMRVAAHIHAWQK